MEILTLRSGVSKEDFWFNFCQLKDKSNIAFPLDYLSYKCQCDERIILCKNGEYFLDGPVSNLVERLTEDKKALHREHLDKTKCSSKQTLTINPETGMPDNLIVFLDESNMKDILPLEIENTSYEPILSIVTSGGAVLTLYRGKHSEDDTYLNFFRHNFENHLDQVEEDQDETDQSEAETAENLVSDDESVSQNQDMLPRLTGGGRKLQQEFRYVCYWCSDEVLKQKNRGRFRELRNYRDHFRKAHSDVPMREFLLRVDRNEPTWFCNICRRKISLGNQLRHQVICRPFVEEAANLDISKPSGSKATATQTVEISSIPIDVSKRQLEPSDDNEKRKRVSYGAAPLNLSTAPEVAHSSQNIAISTITDSGGKKVYDEYDFDAEIELEEESIMSEVDQQENEEINDLVIEEAVGGEAKFIKWWLLESKDRYFTKEDIPLAIFEKDDSEDFVKTVKENISSHFDKKLELDIQMTQMESSEEQLNQFSKERDLPILNAFQDYVKKSSTKDILGFFSTDPDPDNVQKSTKSAGTSKQYSYRITEFFNYMAKTFKGFHLDWMFDYKFEIEKLQPDGAVTNEIFVPPQDVLKEFIKSFLYGSNPAANAGMRVFAVKKFLEMMRKKFKENEHLFPGTINEKSATVETLVKRLVHLEDELCPTGMIKHITKASNRNHRTRMAEKLKKCPQKSLETIMKGVAEYWVSDLYADQKRSLFELAYVTTRIPASRQYISLTNWLLELLVCIGGNRPCSILGITIKDWEERKAGFCPFNQSEQNDLIVEDPMADSRKILANPFEKPADSDSEEPTGVIVKSDADKITVGPPCYIWFPKELEELVQAHSLMASKFFTNNVDIFHPETRLFLNSQGNAIRSIECKHFKEFIGLPIVAYDFRKSLSTFCLESTDENIRKSEPSVLRHSKDTAYAYYFQKHGENVEYVNIRYAVKHGLVRASAEDVDKQLDKLRENGLNEEWELSQKRSDKALAFAEEIMQRSQERHNDSQIKKGRNWILPREYNDFIGGIMKAINLEEERRENGVESGPFSHLLKYKPGAEEAGVFPPNSIWWKDMCRVLFGLQGPEGDAMRMADLSVYNGVPFAAMSGRKKIEQEKSKNKGWFEEYMIVGQYWRIRIKDEASKAAKGKWNEIRFVFKPADLVYFKSLQSSS